MMFLSLALAFTRQEPAAQHVGYVKRDQALRSAYAAPDLKPAFKAAAARLDQFYAIGKSFFGTPKGYAADCSSLSEWEGAYRRLPGFGAPYANVYYLVPFYYDEGRHRWGTDETSTMFFQAVNAFPRGLAVPLAFDATKNYSGFYVVPTGKPGSSETYRIMDTAPFDTDGRIGGVVMSKVPILRELTWADYFQAVRTLSEKTLNDGTQYKWKKDEYALRTAHLDAAMAKIPESRRGETAKLAFDDGGLRYLNREGSYFEQSFDKEDGFRLVKFVAPPGATVAKVNVLSIFWTYNLKQPYSKGFAEKAPSYPFEAMRKFLTP